MLSSKKENFQEISEIEYKNLKKIFKKYTNLYKSLYLFDPVLASEFKNKNELYMNEKFKKFKKDHTHSDSQNSCCSGKITNKIYIPKDKLNNIEKILNEIYETFFYPSNLPDLLNFLSVKLEKILNSGFKDGLKLDEDSETQLIHKICLEGIPFYIVDKIKNHIKKYEESISEQPMLLAHPSGVKNLDIINFIDSKNIEFLVNQNYFSVDKKIYYQIDEYKLFDEFKYLYSEGYFEDISIKIPHRKDLIYKFNLNYFKNSKHKQLSELCNLIYFLPFELNGKHPNLSLQTNDYLIASYFQEKSGSIKMNIDSSFDNDTGKKITIIIPIFSRDLEVCILFDNILIRFLKEKLK